MGINIENLLWIRYKGGNGDFDLVGDLILTVEDSDIRFWHYNSDAVPSNINVLTNIVVEIQEYYNKEEKESKESIRNIIETERYLRINN